MHRLAFVHRYVLEFLSICSHEIFIHSAISVESPISVLVIGYRTCCNPLPASLPKADQRFDGRQSFPLPTRTPKNHDMMKCIPVTDCANAELPYRQHGGLCSNYCRKHLEVGHMCNVVLMVFLTITIQRLESRVTFFGKRCSLIFLFS